MMIVVYDISGTPITKYIISLFRFAPTIRTGPQPTMKASHTRTQKNSPRLQNGTATINQAAAGLSPCQQPRWSASQISRFPKACHSWKINMTWRTKFWNINQQTTRVMLCQHQNVLSAVHQRTDHYKHLCVGIRLRSTRTLLITPPYVNFIFKINLVLPLK